MKSAEQKRLDPCYGEFRCWNQVQAMCPVALECERLAKKKYGIARKIDQKRR